jgi:hypothetical protein
MNELVATKEGASPSADALFIKWMYPIITNLTFLFTPCVGEWAPSAVIDLDLYLY